MRGGDGAVPWEYDGVSWTVGGYRHMLRRNGRGLANTGAQLICTARTDLPAALNMLEWAINIIRSIDDTFPFPETNVLLREWEQDSST